MSGGGGRGQSGKKGAKEGESINNGQKFQLTNTFPNNLDSAVARYTIKILAPGSNPARPGGFPGANSPGPVADLYGTANQDSGVGNYISAASPQPGSGFGHGIAGPLIATAFTNGYH
ncbi:UNVERIFIED_CONTAM: hypothetical protein K2H54_037124 [Gekko kuhli]